MSKTSCVSHPAFECLRRHPIPALHLEVQEFRHRVTWARHLHLASDDSHKVFLVAFLTLPRDSSGVAHILEHTVLCGSRRYPVRDPFFTMTRRSLSTFMNAFTSNDWTVYPFASENCKDFDNLLKVYLDAVFFPLLEELDFAQEGCRVEFSKPEDPHSEMVFKGVVFNEMKGALSSPVERLAQTLHTQLFPTTPYHYNVGGDPEVIPQLSHAQLRAFHGRHYHPSNAIFMTYGDIAAAEHQARFQDYALRWFEAPGKVPQVPDEHRFATPISVVTPYPLEAVDPADKTHIVLGWLLDKVTNPLTAMQARVLASVLLDNSSSPLRHALETSSLGSAPSPLCGFDDSTRETTFVCGLEGCNPEDAQAVEELALGVIRQVAEHGVPREALESALHQLELSEREVTGDGFPYGLRLLMTALTPALHGGDPAAALDIDPVLDSLRRETAEPEFIKNLTARLLLHNPHRVRLTMVPDLSLGARQAEAERQRLAALQAAMSAADKQRVLAQTRALRTRQQRVEDAELLPRVGLEDIAAELRIPEGRRCSVSSMPATWYARGTNGMVYQQLVVDLPAMEESWLDLLPLFCLCLTEVGSAGRDYRATQARQAAVTGGISTHCLVRGDVDDVQAIKGVMVLAGKALARNQAALTELLVETFGSARFDELPRLRELIAQRRGEHEETVTDRGHGLVITAASAGLSPAAALNHRWAGLMGLRTLKALDDALEDQAQLSRFAEQLAGIRDCIANAPRQLLLVSEAEEQQSMAETLARFWPNWPGPESAVGGLAVGVGNAVRRQGWVTSTQVNFCARVYPAVPQNHPDAPALQVLGDFLRNGYLHRTVREEGGAYGVGAHYDSDSGAFRFYSYRDPRLAETLQDFDRALSWLQLSQHRERALEEAILSVIAAIDRPGSPAGEAIDAFIAELFGRTAGQRRAFRQGVLRVTLADLQRVGSTYLQPGRASSAVLSNLETLRGQPEMEIFTL